MGGSVANKIQTVALTRRGRSLALSWGWIQALMYAERVLSLLRMLTSKKYFFTLRADGIPFQFHMWSQHVQVEPAWRNAMSLWLLEPRRDDPPADMFLPHPKRHHFSFSFQGWLRINLIILFSCGGEMNTMHYFCFVTIKILQAIWAPRGHIPYKLYWVQDQSHLLLSCD
jgi:hypothetical protein